MLHERWVIRDYLNDVQFMSDPLPSTQFFVSIQLYFSLVNSTYRSANKRTTYSRSDSSFFCNPWLHPNQLSTMGGRVSRDNSTTPSSTGPSRSRQQQQQQESRQAPPPCQLGRRFSPPIPAPPGWNTESSKVSQQLRERVRHADGCRCIDCQPDLYDNSGSLKTGFGQPCMRLGCVCPVCRERDSCHLRSEGHLLPDKRQCRNANCVCKMGCEDWNCKRCVTALTRRTFKCGTWGYV